MRAGLTSLIVTAINERGTATLDDLAEWFPQATRRQLDSALNNARVRGYLAIVKHGRGKGRGRGSEPCVHATTAEAARLLAETTTTRVLRRCAFEPPVPVSMSGVGRQVHPLGGW